MVEAAPAIVFGLEDEAAGDRIAVDVADLFDAFFFGVDVEVVVAALPELFLVGKFELAGDELLEDLEKGGEGSGGGFVGEEMDVLRHEDVGRDTELLLLTGLLEDLLGDVFCGVGCEEGLAAVATEGDEVEVLCLLVASEHPTSRARGDPVEAGGHGGASSLQLTLRKAAKDRAPAPDGLGFVVSHRMGTRHRRLIVLQLLLFVGKSPATEKESLLYLASSLLFHSSIHH